MKRYLSRAQSRFLSAFEPVGDPFGGPAFGEKTEPTTIAIMAAAASAVGAMAQAGAASASAQSQANAGAYNAQVDQQRADSALAISNSNQEDLLRRNRVAAGQLRAGLVESGIGIDSGTGSDLVAQSSHEQMFDVLKTGYQGQLNAKGLRDQGTLDAYGAGVARANASAAMTSGYISAGASALTGYGKYVRANTLTSGG